MGHQPNEWKPITAYLIATVLLAILSMYAEWSAHDLPNQYWVDATPTPEADFFAHDYAFEHGR